MSRSCSQCGNNGHNSRTCADATAAENGIMLFGVRVTAEGSSSSSFRKSVSMNNLSQFDQPVDSNADAGYASDDVVHPSVRSRERKRGVPWTEEEHKLFLLGLQKVGKGDWRGISRNFVKTRTPTQVASHAQKYFLRRFNQNRRRRRSSLFDITTDSFLASSSMEIEEGVGLPPAQPQPQPQTRQPTPTPYLSVTGESSTIRQARPLSTKLIRPIPILPIPPSSKMADLNLNEKPNHVDPPLPLSLNLTTSEEQQQQQQSSAPTASQNSHSSSSAFQTMSSGDSIISVA